MNPFPRHLPGTLLVALALALVAGPARGGAILTRAGVAMVGSFVEGETTLSRQVPDGAVEYRKDTLLWFTTAAEVDSLLKAAQKARADGNTAAALSLLEQSATQEPATQAQARAEIEGLRSAIANQSATTAATNAPTATLVTPEDKITKGARMIDGASNVLAAPFIDAKNAAAAHDVANKNMAEGSRLVAEGQKELADQQAKAAAEAARRQEVQAAAAPASSEWTQADKLANLAVAGFLAIMILSSIHRIANREPKN